MRGNRPRSLENDTFEASAGSGVGPIVTASCQNPTCLPLLLPMGAGAGMQSHAYLIKNNNNSLRVCARTRAGASMQEPVSAGI